ncbi:histidine kinase [Embleya sp. NPDC020630]|uniref:sensor histidine kinase n=1 Tax=Embleya sp. NPDC020630 TaxID=3363979 RepID=UPI0037A41711
MASRGRRSVPRIAAGPRDDAAWAPLLARVVVATVTCGFFFGGFVGLVQSTRLSTTAKGAALAMLLTLVALHMRNCVRPTDGSRPRGWVWTLGAQAVLTYLPMTWFHDTWYGNPGFLAGAALLLLRPAWAGWAGFAAVVAVQVPVGLAVRPTVVEALYLVFGQAALVGLAVYALAGLTDLVAALAATRTALADAEVARERLRFTRHLTDGVGASLTRIVERGEALVAELRECPERARVALTEALAEARGAMTEVRAYAHAHKSVAGTPPPAIAVEPTPRAVSVLRVVILVLIVVPLPVRMLAASHYSPARQALFLLLLAGFVALYIRNCTPAAAGRPRGWRWTFAAQVALAYVPLVVFDAKTWSLGLFLAGIALVLLRGPWRVLAVIGFACHDLYFGTWSPTALDHVYHVVWILERAALVFGLVRMADVARALNAARAELAAVRVARERLRFGHDLHDLLGFSLSALVLESQLALRLADRDPESAAERVAQGLTMARQALADVGTVAGGYRGMSLAVEARSARDVLAAAGMAVEVSVEVGALPVGVDTALATVLREGTTNVLRHSDARRCAITAAVEPCGEVVLVLTNDGVRAPVGPAPTAVGMGLGSLGRRLAAEGGTLSAGVVDGGFRLAARIPGPTPARLPGDEPTEPVRG